jgi:hypothetical protein
MKPALLLRYHNENKLTPDNLSGNDHQCHDQRCTNIAVDGMGGSTMKNQARLAHLFRSMTGKSLYTPKPEAVNPAGYQVPRVDRIRRYGGE